MASGRVVLRDGLPPWVTLTRAPEIPAVRCRNRSAISPALSSRSSHRLSGMATKPVFTSAPRPKPPVRVITRLALPRSTLGLGDFFDLAQLAIEIPEAGTLRSPDEDAHEGTILLRCGSLDSLSAENGMPNTNSSSTRVNKSQRAAHDPPRAFAHQRVAQHLRIAVVEIVEHAIDAADHA